MHEAQFYEKKENKTVQCHICPRNCVIDEGKRGFCLARKNIDGKLYLITYGRPCSIAIDPIEKKPFFHFHPGTRTLSLATVGCNFACDFCQNWMIARGDIEKEPETPEVPPEALVDMAIQNEVQGLSYTYTEPTIFYEYAYDTAKLAHEKGLYNTFVSNGYISEEPLKKLSKYLDAMNIDLKAFTDDFYKKVCHAPQGIEPVKQTARNCKKFGVHLEVTNLIIPGYNDKEAELREIAKFVHDDLGAETPLHFSRFYPHYKMKDVPITDVKTLELAQKIAKEEGLEYVYIGNVPAHKGENTYCPKCKELLIERVGFEAKINNLRGKRCGNCGKEIAIVV